MKIARPFILLALVLAACCLAVAWSAQRWLSARAGRQAVTASLEALVRDAQEVLDLSAKQERIAARERPTQDVIAQVNSVLAEVGIPTGGTEGHFKSLTPESDSLVTAAAANVKGPRYKKQSLRLTLDDLSMDQVGSFLLHWRQAQEVWMPSRIELTHVRGQNNNQSDRYQASILLSALYIADV